LCFVRARQKNDPVIFLEYAVDVAQACRERGIKTVAVSAG
jgi:pyruvate formate lyase activating enzyme